MNQEKATRGESYIDADYLSLLAIIGVTSVTFLLTHKPDQNYYAPDVLLEKIISITHQGSFQELDVKERDNDKEYLPRLPTLSDNDQKPF